jgi:hypothetical protein
MNQSLSSEQRADLLLRAMTLDEKISMVHGQKPIPILGYIEIAARLDESYENVRHHYYVGFRD